MNQSFFISFAKKSHTPRNKKPKVSIKALPFEASSSERLRSSVTSCFWALLVPFLCVLGAKTFMDISKKKARILNRIEKGIFTADFRKALNKREP